MIQQASVTPEITERVRYNNISYGKIAQLNNETR
jgi:hypothetical protein